MESASRDARQVIPASKDVDCVMLSDLFGLTGVFRFADCLLDLRKIPFRIADRFKILLIPSTELHNRSPPFILRFSMRESACQFEAPATRLYRNFVVQNFGQLLVVHLQIIRNNAVFGMKVVVDHSFQLFTASGAAKS